VIPSAQSAAIQISLSVMLFLWMKQSALITKTKTISKEAVDNYRMFASQGHGFFLETAKIQFL